MRSIILALVAPVLAVPALATPAQATTGSVSYSEYQRIDPGDSLSSVGVMCGCSGDSSTHNGDLWVFYKAENSTFALNVTQVEVIYSRGANGNWQAQDAARCGPAFGGCHFDW